MARPLLRASLLIYLAYLATAYDFYVGGRNGWVMKPDESYSLWSSRRRFLVNDQLVFKYKKGEDSVLQVMKDDYDSCNVNNPIKKFNDGNTVLAFDRTGPFFFISGEVGHCSTGQKLVVVVLALRNKNSPPPSVYPLPAPAAKPPNFSPSGASPSSSASPPSLPSSAGSSATSPSSSSSPSGSSSSSNSPSSSASAPSYFSGPPSSASPPSSSSGFPRSLSPSESSSAPSPSNYISYPPSPSSTSPSAAAPISSGNPAAAPGALGFSPKGGSGNPLPGTPPSSNSTTAPPPSSANGIAVSRFILAQLALFLSAAYLI